VLLSLATVLAAWSAFQSAKWSGVQATRFNQASASRTESIRASTTAGQEALADVTVFTAWLNATELGERSVADALASRFRGEFATAFKAWKATDPLHNPAAPATPFVLPQYRRADSAKANELLAAATKRFDEATRANQISDNYVLLTVLAATVLFFVGVSTQLERLEFRMALVGLALVVFLVSTGCWRTSRSRSSAPPEAHGRTLAVGATARSGLRRWPVDDPLWSNAPRSPPAGRCRPTCSTPGGPDGRFGLCRSGEPGCRRARARAGDRELAGPGPGLVCSGARAPRRSRAGVTVRVWEAVSLGERV
jgi:hypothetical protein